MNKALTKDEIEEWRVWAAGEQAGDDHAKDVRRALATFDAFALEIEELVCNGIDSLNRALDSEAEVAQLTKVAEGNKHAYEHAKIARDVAEAEIARLTKERDEAVARRLYIEENDSERVAELESACAAMRFGLERIVRRSMSNDDAAEEAADALSSDAGRTLLAEVEALRKVEVAARKGLVQLQERTGELHGSRCSPDTWQSHTDVCHELEVALAALDAVRVRK